MSEPLPESDRPLDDKRYMEYLARKVEERMGRGPVKDWSQRDFQILSDQIAKATREHISVTTLKRVLGRVRYEGTPYLHTLNMISHFLGYPSWGQFKEMSTEQVRTMPDRPATSYPQGRPFGMPPLEADEPLRPTPVPGPIGEPVMAESTDTYPDLSTGTSGEAPHTPTEGDTRPAPAQAPYTPPYRPAEAVPVAPLPRPFYRNPLLMGVLGVVALGLTIYLASRLLGGGGPSGPRIDFEGRARLEAMLIPTDSLPQQVIFSYTGPVPDTTNILVATYEPGKFQYFSVGPKGTGKHSHTYDRPGYYDVRVYSNRQLVSRAPVLIPTRGWQAQLRSDVRTVYLPPGHPVASNGSMTARQAQRAGIDTLRSFKTVLTRYRNFNLSADRCTLALEVRNLSAATLPEARDAGIIIRLKAEYGEVIVPMAEFAPPGGFFFKVSDAIPAPAERARISPNFVTGLSDYRRVRLVMADNQLTVFIDDQAAHTIKYRRALGLLMGIELTYNGVGGVRNLNVTDQAGQTLWHELDTEAQASPSARPATATR